VSVVRCTAETIISFRVQHRTRSQSPNCSNDSISRGSPVQLFAIRTTKKASTPWQYKSPERLADTHGNIFALQETFYVPLWASDHTTAFQMVGGFYDRSNTTAEEPVKKFGFSWFGLVSNSLVASNTSGAFTVSEAYVPRARVFEGDQSIVADANLKFPTGIRTTADQFGPFTSSVCPSRLLVLLAGFCALRE
jgi:hypothetical protein